MPDSFYRTLTMRSAVSLNGFGQPGTGPGSLRGLVHTVLERYRTIRTRRAIVDGKVIELRNSQANDDGSILLHLVAYTPDDQLSVVPNPGNRASAGLELIDAPEDTEFLDGEFELLIAQDDVALCKSGIGENDFISFVLALGTRAGQLHYCAFRLMKRADMDKLELLRREGIKSVSMNTVAHAAAIDYVERRTVKQRIIAV